MYLPMSISVQFSEYIIKFSYNVMHFLIFLERCSFTFLYILYRQSFTAAAVRYRSYILCFHVHILKFSILEYKLSN